MVRKVVLLGMALAAIVVTVILIASPWITESYFGGDWVMLVALVIAFASYAPVHLARGIASGSGRFRAYAVVMGADGAVRVLLCIALAIVGIKTVGPYGMAVALAPLAGFFYVYMRGQLRHRGRPAGQLAGSHPQPGLAAARLGLRCRPGQCRPGGRNPDGRREREGTGHSVRLRRAALADSALPVPGGAGRAAAAARAAGRPQRVRRVPQRLQAS